MSPSWFGPLFVSVRDNLYHLWHATGMPCGVVVDGVIEASGPVPLRTPSRPLTRQELRDWVTAWSRAGYRFKVTD